MKKLQLLGELAAKVRTDNVFNGAASLAFFFTLAVFPGVILLIGALPMLPVEQVDEATMALLRRTLPRELVEIFERVISDALGERDVKSLSVASLVTLWAASTGMYAAMRQLNVTWSVEDVRTFFQGRAVAIGLTLVIGALILISLAAVLMARIAYDELLDRYGSGAALGLALACVRWTIGATATLAGISLVYHFGPHRHTGSIRFATPGRVLATGLILLATAGFNAYARFADYSAVYGGIAAVVALMVWAYVAGFVFLLGSELDALLERHAQTA